MPIQCPYCNSLHPDESKVCPSTGKELSQALRLVGKTMGKYEILCLLGEGGMGAVYEARHRQIRRKVALKLLNPQMAHDQEVMARFVREARTTGEIGHENIIEIYDIGKDPATGAVFLVLELLKGKTLQDLIDETKGIPSQEAVDIMLQVLSALHASHSLGIIHRDLKPENIFLITLAGRKNWAKILDFGIAKIKQTEDGHKLTQTGTMMGTPYYMAPEQIKGSKEIDQRLDLYACGIILYQCITGKVPYDSPTVPGLVYSILNKTPENPRTSQPDTPDELSDIILKSMSRELDGRFQSAMEMASALEKFGSGVMEVEQEIKKGDELTKTLKGKLGEIHTAAESTSTELDWKKSQAGMPAPGKGKKVITIAAIVAVLVLLAVGGYFIVGSGWLGNKDDPSDALPGKAIPAAPDLKPVLVNESSIDKAEDGKKEEAKIDLTIKASPEDSVIYLDGAPVRQNPYNAKFPISETPHRIEIRLDGYASYMEWIEFTESIMRDIKLEALEPAKDKEKKGKKKKGTKKPEPETKEPASPKPAKKKTKKEGIYETNPYGSQ